MMLLAQQSKPKVWIDLFPTYIQEVIRNEMKLESAILYDVDLNEIIFIHEHIVQLEGYEDEASYHKGFNVKENTAVVEKVDKSKVGYMLYDMNGVALVIRLV